MNSITNNTWIQSLKDRAEYMMQNKKIEQTEYDCSICEDKGYLFDNEGAVSWCECKLKKDAQERLIKSGISDRVKTNTFKNYKQDNDQRKDAVNTCLKYLSDFKEKYPSLILMGEVGAGKTHLAIATANKLLSKYVVKYVLYEDIRALKFSLNDREHYNSVISNLREVQVLFIDDLFKGLEKDIDASRAKAELDVVYEIINHRYNNKKPVLITTELNINRMMQIDKAIASRILEMCKGYRINFDGIELNYRVFGD